MIPLRKVLETLSEALQRDETGLIESRLEASLEIEDDPTLQAVFVSIMKGEDADVVLRDMGLFDE